MAADLFLAFSALYLLFFLKKEKPCDETGGFTGFSLKLLCDKKGSCRFIKSEKPVDISIL